MKLIYYKITYSDFGTLKYQTVHAKNRKEAIRIAIKDFKIIPLRCEIV